MSLHECADQLFSSHAPDMTSCSSQPKQGTKFWMLGKIPWLISSFKAPMEKAWLLLISALLFRQHRCPKLRPKACTEALDHTISARPVTPPLFSTETSSPLRHMQGQSSDLQTLVQMLANSIKTWPWAPRLNNEVKKHGFLCVTNLMYEKLDLWNIA